MFYNYYEVLSYYNRTNELHCWYCNKSTDTSISLDQNPNNFLISNLLVCCTDCAAKQFSDGVPGLMSTEGALSIHTYSEGNCGRQSGL
jgi:hypothetical protein